MLAIAGCGRNEVEKPRPGGSALEPPNTSGLESRTSEAPASGSAVVGDRPGNASGPRYVPSTKDPSPFRFREIAEGSGVDFIHYSGMTKDKYYPSANGSGVAIFDFDNDGLMDLYFATCTEIPLGAAKKSHGTNKLYKNLGGGKFRDATAAAGLGFEGFCNGITCGDFDNDGDQDVLLSNYGEYVLYENQGDGTFKDISKQAGVQSFFWSSGGAFLDYDNDGDLDVYLANYGKWTYPEDDKFCGDHQRNIRIYCGPGAIVRVRHVLFRNNGNRTFTDVTEALGIDKYNGEYGHGFGVVTSDLDGDGLIDIYVANDMNPNFLFFNDGKGGFRAASIVAGAALDENGQPRSGMGVDAEDVDGDGLPDLFVTNFANEPNSLFKNLGGGGFIETTGEMGLASDSVPFVGWGCTLSDFDNDGWPDVFVTNGHVDDNLRTLGREVDYEEPPLLFRNLEGKRFKLATSGVGPYFESKHVGRGAAFGDLDNDGDMDVVVNQRDGRPAILINETPTKNNWIRLIFKGAKSNRDGVGVRVVIDTGKRMIVRQRKGGASMSSSNDPRLLVGVGETSELPKVSIFWPSGAKQVLTNVKTDRTIEVVEESSK